MLTTKNNWFKKFNKTILNFVMCASISKKNDSKISKEDVEYKIESRKNYFDSGEIKVLKNFSLECGVLVVYYIPKTYCFGAVLFDKKTNKVVYRTANPFFKNELPLSGIKVELKKDIIKISFKKNDEKEEWEFSIDYILGKENKNIEQKSNTVKCIIEKCSVNPIIKPIVQNVWESCGTFNPTAINIDGNIHILYRAIGGDGGSVIGYALSKNGITIDERLPYPIYKPTGEFELRVNKVKQPSFPYSSGDGYDCWGGCEDPRVTKLDNKIYMIYTAFNGVQPPCVAMTSIKVDDFLNRNWSKWNKPVLLSPKNQMHKNWVIFPEKINGKYAILHSITPDIQIAYLDTLEFKENPNIQSKYVQVKNKDVWDTVIRGVGPAPLKIDEGWLVFYHAINEKEPGKYKIGAMILDYKNPTKILYKSTFPIIEPDQKYENEGCKGGVVYTCGATIKDDDLILYYGGADTVVCVATCNLKKFVQQIKDNNGKI